MAKAVLRYQRGIQERVLKCKADVAVVGGAMGSGKTFAIILDILSHCHDPLYRAVIFREKKKSLRGSGGVWDEIITVCNEFGIPILIKNADMRIIFYSGASVEMLCVRSKNFKEDIKGYQFTAIFIDEATAFDADVVQFVFSRNRSRSSIPPYIRLTANPSDGYLKDMVNIFLNDESYPDPELCKKTAYLHTHERQFIVRFNKEDFLDCTNLEPKDLDSRLMTFEFIPGTIAENKRMLDVNPKYMSRFDAMTPFERKRYLEGWWGDIPNDALFNRNDFDLYPKVALKDIDQYVMVCDPAFSGKSRSDYTVAACFGMGDDGLYLVDMIRGKWRYLHCKERILGFIEDHSDYAKKIYIENIGGNSSGLIAEVSKGNATDCKVLPISQGGVVGSRGKVHRGSIAKVFLKSKRMFLPAGDNYGAMRKVFINELCGFSVDMSHKHDDICDVFFYACQVYKRSYNPEKGGKVDSPPKEIINIESRL